MGEIIVNKERLKELIFDLQKIEEKINSFAGNGQDTGYVKDNLFEESTGKSEETLEEMLKILVDCSSNVSQVIINTKKYFNDIIIGFKEEDERQAKEIKKLLG